MSNIHFIKAPCHQSSRKQGFQFGPDFIKEKYDYSVDIKSFNGTEISHLRSIKLCNGYQELYNYILNFTKKNSEHKIVTIGGDHSISSSTIVAMNEKYLKQVGDKCYSNLKILYIDALPDIKTWSTTSTMNLNEMTSSSLFGLIEPTFTKHKLLLEKEQIVYFGLSEEDLEDANEYGLNYFTLKKIKQIGTLQILEFIDEKFQDSPIHISIDMKVFNKSLAPSTERICDDGLDMSDIHMILDRYKDKVVSMDIVEFNPFMGNKNDTIITKKTAQRILQILFGIKEKSINIFNENSEFLIYRPLTQLDPICDYGWYIMRGVNLKERERLLKSIQDDLIITINIDDTDYLITKTTIEEQNKKSCYSYTKIEDVVLFPEEKKVMCFELLNTKSTDSENE